MAKSPFVGRHRELQLLDDLWGSTRATLLILYGRRRVGKTRLLTHWLHRHAGDGLYWMAEATSALDQLRSFSQALIHFEDPHTPAPPEFTYATWDLALRQVALLAQKRRISLVIDEVTYLMDVNPDIIGTLQKAWDHWLSDANLMLALSGSQMNLMRKHLLDYEAPLYGRATAQMQLPPLPFGNSQLFFPDYSIKERIALYSMWGGVPAYWERLDPQKSVLENLRQHLLPSHSWMLDEPRILLEDFITERHNYVGILRAIADGKQSLGEISKRTGLTSNHTSFYLSVLRDTGFVARRVPVTQDANKSRRGRYYVTDPYLRFYYRFLSDYQNMLAMGREQQVMQLVEDNLPAFIEDNTWEELCREWLLVGSAEGEIPVTVTNVGSEWKRSLVVDVVGINEQEKKVVLGDCYWRPEATGPAVIEELVQKTGPLLPKKGKWSVYYLGFSANGWTKKAQEKAEKIIHNKNGKKWQPLGIRLLDLEEVDSDLTRWAVTAESK